MAVPSYCVGQSLEYLSSRGYSKKDFTPEQLLEEVDMFKTHYISEEYEEFSNLRYIRQGYKLKTIICASGNYKVWSKDKEKEK